MGKEQDIPVGGASKHASLIHESWVGGFYGCMVASTENVFWVHDETNEMSMDMPASLKMRNKLNEEREKTEMMHKAALDKMKKDKAGSNKKSGGFKKRR